RGRPVRTPRTDRRALGAVALQPGDDDDRGHPPARGPRADRRTDAVAVLGVASEIPGRVVHAGFRFAQARGRGGHLMRTRRRALVLVATFALIGGGAGLVNGSGTASAKPQPMLIVTGAGASGGPHVREFDSAGHDTGVGFFAYDPGFSGGVRVGTGD